MTAPRRTQDPAEAARVLDAGGVVLMPTDTLPGLHARLDRPAALARIRALKGRDADKPLLVLAASADVAGAWVRWDEAAAAEAASVWPGPYTLILTAVPEAPTAVTGGGPTLAVRVPADPRLRSLLDVVGAPLASTSANDAGRAPATDLDAAAAWAGGGVDLVADLPWGGSGRPSTLVDLTRRPPRVLRAGAGDPLPGWESVTDDDG
ncbi:MAG TPA: L-threonylcarbamoyladenylate synthase [Candidatus Krumholzibacteria bacterium]|nr:L-threonylcarbamoyladenylate synthase [Candidatus Krumholzibacteria bacterium]